MPVAIFRTNKGEKEAEVIKENPKTVWVALDKKGKPNHVKRHRRKYVVRIVRNDKGRIQ